MALKINLPNAGRYAIHGACGIYHVSLWSYKFPNLITHLAVPTLSICDAGRACFATYMTHGTIFGAGETGSITSETGELLVYNGNPLYLHRLLATKSIEAPSATVMHHILVCRSKT